MNSMYHIMIDQCWFYLRIVPHVWEIEIFEWHSSECKVYKSLRAREIMEGCICSWPIKWSKKITLLIMPIFKEYIDLLEIGMGLWDCFDLFDEMTIESEPIIFRSVECYIRLIGCIETHEIPLILSNVGEICENNKMIYLFETLWSFCKKRRFDMFASGLEAMEFDICLSEIDGFLWNIAYYQGWSCDILAIKCFYQTDSKCSCASSNIP